MKAVTPHQTSPQRRVRRFPASQNAIGVARATSQSRFSIIPAEIRPEKKRFIRLRVTRRRQFATTFFPTTLMNRRRQAATLIPPAHQVDNKTTNIAKKIFTAYVLNCIETNWIVLNCILQTYRKKTHYQVPEYFKFESCEQQNMGNKNELKVVI